MGLGRLEASHRRRAYTLQTDRDDDRVAATDTRRTATSNTGATNTGATNTTAGNTAIPTIATRNDARARHLAGGAMLAHELHARFESTTRAVADNFALFSGGDDHVTREDLEKMRDGRVAGSTAEMREQARFILESPAYMNALDVGAGKGDVDGKISREDLEGATERLATQDWSGPTIGVSGAIDSEAEARTVLERYGFLSDTAGGKGGANGHISNDDVRALLADPNIPDDLRQAAQFIENGGVELPGDGDGGFLDTITSPFEAGGEWIGDQASGGADSASRAARDRLFPHDELSDEERDNLLELASTTAADEAGAAELPLNEQHNAHHSNTPEEMREALEGDYQWMEGDIRRDPAIMAHDWQSDGLSLRDWLAIGKESGRGLKLDIKEGESVDSVIEELQRADIPQDRLILNADVMAGPGGSGRNISPEQLQQLRDAFPEATIAIGAKTGRTPEGTTYTEAQVEEMISLAEQIGGPVMFPLRAELVTPEIVERLSAHGTVAIWNDPSTYPLSSDADIEAAEQRFRDMGVTGIIDLRS